ncbi:Hypothetical protein PYTT_1093 [Akkermansia glycaniphila]|uniref:Uncharacterized protein n=1 Tax=Akkermansia glycaniphila TaxID=1679444 RepID=A0A1H6L5I5_9BACT|nr:Hypothetical protein PYTT_1093 [Akkermansia glycaniphila]
MKKLTISLSVVLLVAGLILSPLAWILKDGLGPESVESEHMQSLHKWFFTFYWGPLVIAGLTLLYLGKSSTAKHPHNGIGSDLKKQRENRHP